MTSAISTVTTDDLQAFADAWNRHDIDALMSFMTDDCAFESSAGPDVCGTRYAGREAVRAGFADVWAVFPTRTGATRDTVGAQERDGSTVPRWFETNAVRRRMGKQ